MRDYRKIRRRVDISLDKQQVMAIFSGLFVGAALIFCLGLVVGRHSAAPAEARLQNPATEKQEITTDLDKLEDIAEPLPAEEPKETPVMVGLSQQEDASAKDKKPLDPRKSKAKPDEGKKGKRSSNKPRAVSSNNESQNTGNGSANFSGKRYTVQLKACKDIEEAKDLIKEMKNKGIDCFMEKAPKGDNEIWYRVRSGHFGSELEARLYMTKLNGLGISKAWVAKIE